MISFLAGEIKIKTEKFIILQVGGIGYKVFCSAPTLKEIGSQGRKTSLFTYLYCRENIMDLYGFISFEELEFFELLISVSGIGPKAALSVMMLASVKTLKEAIASGRKSLLTKVSGIGQRTAERIILELKNKIFASVSDIQKLTSDSEVIDALVSLGYSQHQAKEALSQIPRGAKGIEEIIKESLKVLGKKPNTK